MRGYEEEWGHSRKADEELAAAKGDFVEASKSGDADADEIAADVIRLERKADAAGEALEKAQLRARGFGGHSHSSHAVSPTLGMTHHQRQAYHEAERAAEAEEAEIMAFAKEKTRRGNPALGVKGVSDTDPTFLSRVSSYMKQETERREAMRKAATVARAAAATATATTTAVEEPARGGAGGWAGPATKSYYGKDFTAEDEANTWRKPRSEPAPATAAAVAAAPAAVSVADAAPSWRSRTAAPAGTTAPATERAGGMWGRSSSSAAVAEPARTTAAVGVLPRDIDAILKKYPVVYRANGDKFRGEYFNKKVEEFAGSKAFGAVQRVKDDVKAQLMKDLEGKVSVSEAPRGYVFDFTVV
jgi:hypothetical protein